MDPATIAALLWTNKAAILGVSVQIVGVAAVLANRTPSDKDDKILSRIGSVLDILSLSFGKSESAQPGRTHNPVGAIAGIKKLAKHAATGKF